MKSLLEPQMDDSQEDGMRPWLREQVYEPKRTRTFELVKKCVDALHERGEPVSLLRIVAESKALDEKGVGVAHSTILQHERANAYYQQYRTSKSVTTTNRSSEIINSDAPPAPVKLNRDLGKVKKRYMKMSKHELINKLISTEQGYASLHKDWVNLNQQLFAEISEMQDDT